MRGCACTPAARVADPSSQQPRVSLGYSIQIRVAQTGSTLHFYLPFRHTIKMTGDRYRKLKAETKRQRVFFNSQKFSSRFSNQVPELHREKFLTVQELGRTLYDTYAFVPGCESLERPWQRENRRKASRLVRDAIRCREANKNESGWRHELEPKVFERFEVEVTWSVSDGLSTGPPASLLILLSKTCRKRLWRSEIEANHDFANSKAPPLKERQARRTPCTCDPSIRLNDWCVPVSHLVSTHYPVLTSHKSRSRD
jgi:hypothetical protein